MKKMNSGDESACLWSPRLQQPLKQKPAADRSAAERQVNSADRCRLAAFRTARTAACGASSLTRDTPTVY